MRKLSKSNEDFIKKYNENSNTGYFLEADVEYPKKLFNLHEDLPFSPERKRIRRVEKLFHGRRQRKICYSHKSFKTNTKMA